MSTITYVKLGSVPITEEGVERYKFSDSIESHITQIAEFTDNINCSVGRIFSKMKLPVSWITVMNANYLIADLDFNNPAASSLHIRAWIDSIEPLSDTEDYPMCEVRWHFDYYEMYKSSVTLGYGHVKRRPFNDIDSTPIQDYQYRYLKLPSDFRTSSTDLTPRYEVTVLGRKWEIWWVFFSFNEDNGGITEIRYGALPVAISIDSYGRISESYSLYIQDSGGGTLAECPSFVEIMSGEFEEYLKIDPQGMNGVWLSPYFLPIARYSGTGYTGDPIIINPTEQVTVYKSGIGDWGYYWLSPIQFTREWSMSFTEFYSTEDKRYIITDLDGVKVLDLPYDLHITKATMVLNVEPTEAHITVSLKDDIYGRAEGTVATIPLISLPINENAWSSYVYSGQREYDREGRIIQSNASAWKTTASGAGSGAMMGAFGPQGLALGVVGGMVGGLVSYGTEMLYQNDEEQRILDRWKSNQTPGLLLEGGGWDKLRYSKGILLTYLEMDGYSATQLGNTRSNFGISVDEILSSCETMVKTTLPTGYYSIKNLIISGSVPKEAKDYIKKKFDAGVKLL